MRIHLFTTPSDKIVPFNYQPHLTGALHKWLGQNDNHDALSLYSFSWLKGGKATKQGLNFNKGACFFISSHDPELLQRLIEGLNEAPSINFGLEVKEAKLQEEPEFKNGSNIFTCASPVFIKRYFYERDIHITHEEEKADEYLTETLKHKLVTAGLDGEGVRVSFDRSYLKARTKVVYYNKIGNKVSICPVKVEGSPEQLRFAWNVGVGNSTGIGFGALK